MSLISRMGNGIMAESTDINLPRAHEARFPNRCVVCSHDNPASHVKLVTGTLGWWTWLLWCWGKPFIVQAPACRGCAWKLQAWRFINLFMTIAIALVAVWLVWPYFKDSVPRSLHALAMMGLALVCLLPQIVFEVFFARPFDVTAYSESVDYEFTSEDYAIDFAMLNLDAKHVKINGEIVQS